MSVLNWILSSVSMGMRPLYLHYMLSVTVKGHLRKGQALLALKDTVKAMESYRRALDLDPNNAVSVLSLCVSNSTCPPFRMLERACESAA